MKQVQYAEVGTADVLKVVEAVKPVAGPGQVLIRVESASVNFSDIMKRRGEYPDASPLPATPGAEVAGIVEAIGDDVTNVAVGDPVFTVCFFGGYSQYVVSDARQVIKLPAGFDLDVACTLVVAGVTAYQILVDVARINKGDVVFIPAATGGVGTYATQIARLKGAGLVIAGAGSEERRAKAIANGADHAVDYGKPNWPDEVKKLSDGRGADIILEMIGGTFFEQSLAALAPFGRIVTYGVVARDNSTIVPQALIGAEQSVHGYSVAHRFGARPEGGMQTFNALIELIQAGQLQVEVSQKYPLERAADAHRAIEERRAIGKSIIKPWI